MITDIKEIEIANTFNRFRRLKHKTQVFVNTSEITIEYRITLSLEVFRIARTLFTHFNFL